ncbi:MAG: hypothetical protein J2P23_06905 [Microlunatus sp.]|nr:hypothetical protein [Microlunatus sp.]
MTERGDEADDHLDRGPDEELSTLLATVPSGWSRTEVAGRTWAVTRTTHARGKVITVTAERLDDDRQLGANIWITSDGPVLRPCELPAETVLQFLRAAAKAYSAETERADQKLSTA